MIELRAFPFNHDGNWSEHLPRASQPSLSGIEYSATLKMDHSQDPCPWVILSNFGGAFSMGVRLLSLPLIYQSWLIYVLPPLGYRWNCLAWLKRFPKLTLRRTTHRSHHSDQSPRTGASGELWSLGRALLDF